MKKVILVVLLMPYLAHGPLRAQLPPKAGTGDLVISEIMADPVPSVSLPEKEYIELTNKSDLSFNLKGWKLLAGSDLYSFPEKIIAPHGFLILCRAADTVLFNKYGRTCGFSSFPVLNDQGKLICIINSSGMMIHGIEYSDSWYGDALKSEGGWSLEMIDAAYPFYDEGNWSASASRAGGSPGSVNSSSRANPDVAFEGLVNVYPVDSSRIAAMFSEPVPDFQDMFEDVKIVENDVSGILPDDPLLRKFIIKLAQPLAPSTRYEIIVPNDLDDFSGNRIKKSRYSFGIPEQSVKGDILFNELLFNPLPGGYDFIEFYNASEKIVDASRLYLVSVNDALADTSGLLRISDIPRCIMPLDYYTISEDEKEAENGFPDGNSEFIFTTADLPSMPDDKGHLILFNRELDIIDEVFYSEKMHNLLLSGNEGISLEKANPMMSSSNPQSWHSAAESSGWGTPGSANSIFVENPVTGEQVSFSSKRITPDADGYEDYLSMGFNFPGIGNVISVSVFDESGSFVKKIAENLLSGPESNLIWDGTAEDGTPVRSGIYIVLITYYNDQGKKGRWKKICTVIRK